MNMFMLQLERSYFLFLACEREKNKLDDPTLHTYDERGKLEVVQKVI